MKKKPKKLALHRETLRSLDLLRHAGGGATEGLRCHDGETIGGACITAATCGSAGCGGVTDLCNTAYPCSVSCFTACLC
jgi:hypothetical protein